MAFVFVHGGGSTGGCWSRLAVLMPPPALVLELPGRPANPADHATITLDLWAHAALAEMDRAGIERATLVGHSMGSVTLMNMAVLAPERVERFVFVSSPFPREGEAISDTFSPRQRDNVRKVAAEGGISTTTAPGTGRSGGFTVPEAVGPLLEPVSLDGLGKGIPATYIKLLRDTWIDPARQDGFIERLRAYCDCSVISIDGGHMAMYAHAREFADVLTSLD